MAIRHSPGPWALTDRTIIAANGENVGGCVVKRMKDGDALLIAAAPNMLEALKAQEAVSKQSAWVSHLANIPSRKNEYLVEATKADEMNDIAVDLRRAALAKVEK